MWPGLICLLEAQTDRASPALIPPPSALSWSLGLLCTLLAGCQTAVSKPLPAGLLPTPIVQVTHQVSPTSTVTASPEPSATPTARPVSLQELAAQTYGERLIRQMVIPAIRVDSPVVTVGWLVDRTADLPTAAAEWDSPGPAVGWVLTSALPDQPGNVILYGHNNMYGSVFRNLGKLNPGDALTLQTDQRTWQYRVDRVVLLPFLNASDVERRTYLAYLEPTGAPRLTVISCWPPESNTHRIVVVAYPAQLP
jgi:LPXTG-site transpeptidase (sortase) family protein